MSRILGAWISGPRKVGAGDRATRRPWPLLGLVAAGLVSVACGGGDGKVQSLGSAETGLVRLGVQAVLGGPTGDPAAIGSVWVRAVPVGAEGTPRELELFPLGDSHAWELPAGQVLVAGTYVFTVLLFAEPTADPGADEALFGTITAMATIAPERESSVLILAGPRPVLPQSALPYVESIIVEPSSAGLREEVQVRVVAGGGTGALTARLRAPLWGEEGFEPWAGEPVPLEAGAGSLRWKVPPIPDFSAVAVRVEDERGGVAEAGLSLAIGKNEAYHPLTWNLPPAAALTGSLQRGEGVEAHLEARLSDDRSATLTYGWESECQLSFSAAGALASGAFEQPVGLEGGDLSFRIRVEGGEACTLTLWAEDEEGSRTQRSVHLDLRELQLSFGDGGESDD